MIAVIELIESFAGEIRLGVFLTILIGMAGWELVAPRRPLTANKWQRWLNHFLLTALNTLLLRIGLPLSVVGAAFIAQERGWGLFAIIPLPAAVEVLGSLLLLDLAIYAQHVAFHKAPLLWRVHLVHHADLDLDVTSGLRFHSIEMLLSALLKIGLVILLGVPVTAVILFEVVLNGAAMFNHSNVRLPDRLDQLLRWVVVTPDMHRVHHSAIPSETDSNYGFNVPWWDYLFGTYRAQPQEGHDGMTLGLSEYRDERQVERLWGILSLPWRRGAPPS